MKPQLKEKPVDQLVMGVAFFNAMFGMPLCLVLIFSHKTIGNVIFPLLLGVPMLLLYVRSRQQSKELPQEMKIWMVLFFLQTCCLGWMLLPDSGMMPIYAYLTLVVVQRIHRWNYKKSGQ